MINWWREGLYLDWLEITFIAVLVGLSLVCVIYDFVNNKEGK